MINKSNHAIPLEQGLYDLCAKRIAGDKEFQSQAIHRNFDMVDDDLFDEYRLWQLKKTLRLVYGNSPFYKRLFDRHHVVPETVKTMADLAKMPFTVSADLSGSSYNFLCTSQSQVEKPVTFYSSGTTGTRKRIFFSLADIQKILDFLPRGMNTVIGREEGRCQIFLQNSNGRGIGGILAQSLRQFGMEAWTSNLEDSVDDIAGVLLDNRVNVWFGDAITIYRASKILAERMDLSQIGMKCIFLTMTNIPDCMIGEMERLWNCRVSTHYGLTESGWGLAVDCDGCSGYHYDELNHYIEIVDPNTGAVLPYGEVGEVVLTNLARDCMPLIRYRTGDIAWMAPSDCGSHLMTLGHIVRRKEGASHLCGREIFPADFEQVLFGTPDVLDYRVFLKGEQLYFEVEVLHADTFHCKALEIDLGALPLMEGAPTPKVRALPVGSLRNHCYEKKRICPLEQPWEE